MLNGPQIRFFTITYAPDSTMVLNGNVTLFSKWFASKPWYSIKSSSDGTKLGAVYTSNDSGVTWIAR